MKKKPNYFIDDENQICFRNRYQLRKAVSTLIDLHPELESEHGGFQVFWVKPDSPLFEPHLLGGCYTAGDWCLHRKGAKSNVKCCVDLFGEHPRLITLAHEVAHILVDGREHTKEFGDCWIKLAEELGVLDEEYIQFYLKKVCRPRDERERLEMTEYKAKLAMDSEDCIGKAVARRLADVHSKFLSDGLPGFNGSRARKYAKMLTSLCGDIRFPLWDYESFDDDTALSIVYHWARTELIRISQNL